MYAKCGALSKAQEVLKGLHARNVFSWTALIGGYAQHGQGEEALMCFDQMIEEGLSADAATFACSLKACGNINAVVKGKKIHDEVARQGLLEKDIVLGTAVVDMYAKCGSLKQARQVLQGLPSRDVISWNALIAGFAQQNQGEEAFKCFGMMQSEGFSPNKATIRSILKACNSVLESDKVENFLDEIAKLGFQRTDLVLGSSMVDILANCGALAKARKVLEELPSRDVVSWNALIGGYAQHGQGDEALNCFKQMEGEGFSANAVTFTCILKACGSIGAVDKGEEIHDELKRQGLLKNDSVLGNALVDMYAKCGHLMKARKVLDELHTRDVVSWSALIAGYVQDDQGEEALKCFDEMQEEGIFPNAMTFSCILTACGSVGALDRGGQIHEEISKQGLLIKDMVLGHSLVEMYSNCGALVKAQRVLEELSDPSVAAWSGLIARYVQEDQAEEAFKCFEKMQERGSCPNEVALAHILKACGGIGAADKGERIHDIIAKLGLLQNDSVLGNALVNMYAKCGALTKAHELLEELPSQNVVVWTALMAGYLQKGQTLEAQGCLKQMQDLGLSPEAFTLTCILNACSHAGLVEEGQMYFTNMTIEHEIERDLEHYSCMVDLFGRAGHLDKALEVIHKMQSSSDYGGMWHALLGACCKWQNVRVGRWAFEHAVQLDPSDASAYVLMYNIYATVGMQHDADTIEAMRVKNKAWKKPGHSWWVDSNGNVHTFLAGDITHTHEVRLALSDDSNTIMSYDKGGTPYLTRCSWGHETADARWRPAVPPAPNHT